MSTANLEIEVRHENGLHLRPAAMFVRTAGAYNADIQVRNVTRDTPFKNAKSYLEVTTQVGVLQGHIIELKAEGEDAAEAIDALRELIDSNFGEQSEA